jgi:hypothetical protein
MVIRWQSRTNDRYYVLRATNIFAPFHAYPFNAIEATPPEKSSPTDSVRRASILLHPKQRQIKPAAARQPARPF